MGSYGIGPTRLLATLVEVLSDDKGMIWPKEASPFQVHLYSQFILLLFKDSFVNICVKFYLFNIHTYIH
jgi:hypothetical protein